MKRWLLRLITNLRFRLQRSLWEKEKHGCGVSAASWNGYKGPFEDDEALDDALANGEPVYGRAFQLTRDAHVSPMTIIDGCMFVSEGGSLSCSSGPLLIQNCYFMTQRQNSILLSSFNLRSSLEYETHITRLDPRAQT